MLRHRRGRRPPPRPRARHSVRRHPGPLNAITDVAPVAVGYTTLIEGAGEHAVRTGVTAILPRGRATLDKPVFAGVFSLNGNGEMTGTHWIEESGFLEGPVMITNTHSVGAVRDAVIAWRIKQGKPDPSGYWWSLPVVAETWDGDLERHQRLSREARARVRRARQRARRRALAEGNVGGGTAMICHEFKCGTGTSSRVVEIAGQRYTVGVLVQANYGVRSELRIAGVPVGKFMPLTQPDAQDHGSIIIVIATDAPLLPQQLKRLARRASLGLARNGSYCGQRLGRPLPRVLDRERRGAARSGASSCARSAKAQLDPLFLATVQAVEESIVNAMVAAETMTGVNGQTVPAIDTGELQQDPEALRSAAALTYLHALEHAARPVHWTCRPLRSTSAADQSIGPSKLSNGTFLVSVRCPTTPVQIALRHAGPRHWRSRRRRYTAAEVGQRMRRTARSFLPVLTLSAHRHPGDGKRWLPSADGAASTSCHPTHHARSSMLAGRVVYTRPAANGSAGSSPRISADVSGDEHRARAGVTHAALRRPLPGAAPRLTLRRTSGVRRVRCSRATRCKSVVRPQARHLHVQLSELHSDAVRTPSARCSIGLDRAIDFAVVSTVTRGDEISLGDARAAVDRLSLRGDYFRASRRAAA